MSEWLDMRGLGLAEWVFQLSDLGGLSETSERIEWIGWVNWRSWMGWISECVELSELNRITWVNWANCVSYLNWMSWANWMGCVGWVRGLGESSAGRVEMRHGPAFAQVAGVGAAVGKWRCFCFCKQQQFPCIFQVVFYKEIGFPWILVGTGFKIHLYSPIRIWKRHTKHIGVVHYACCVVSFQMVLEDYGAPRNCTIAPSSILV